MTQRLRIDYIYRISNLRLEQLWNEDFDYLVTTAIADAEDKVRDETARLLRGTWFTRWYDALAEAEVTLSSQWETRVFTGDPDAKEVRARLRKVRTRLHEARHQFRRRVRLADRGDGRDGSRPLRVDFITGAWLSLLHPEQSQALRDELSQHMGIAKPAWLDYASLDQMRHFALCGLLDAPLTEQVGRLTRMDDEEFRDLVAVDARNSARRIPELRHPVLLGDWRAALHQLIDMNVDRAWARVESDELQALDFTKLAALDQEQARGVLNARRFYRAVLRRLQEWRVVVFETGKLADAAYSEAVRPWHRVEDAVHAELARRHPEQAQAIRAALGPYLAPNSTLWVDRGAFSSQVRGRVRGQVFAELGAQ